MSRYGYREETVLTVNSGLLSAGSIKYTTFDENGTAEVQCIITGGPLGQDFDERFPQRQDAHPTCPTTVDPMCPRWDPMTGIGSRANSS